MSQFTQLNIPQLEDMQPVLDLKCKVAMRHYLEQLETQKRDLPVSVQPVLQQMYNVVQDACDHCLHLYQEDLCKNGMNITSPAPQRSAQIAISDLDPSDLQRSEAIKMHAQRVQDAFTKFDSLQSKESLRQAQDAAAALNTALGG